MDDFGAAFECVNFEGYVVIENNPPVERAENLVLIRCNQLNIHVIHSVDQRRENKVEASFVVGYMPRKRQIVAIGNLLGIRMLHGNAEIDPPQLRCTTVDKYHVLGSRRGVAEAVT